MKIRLHGLPQECAAVAAQLHELLTVVSQSAPYPDRDTTSELVRVYLEVRP